MGYDVLLSTLQGNLSFSTSSVSSFASTHAGPDYFSLFDLPPRHHALSDSRLEPPSRILPHGQPRSFDIAIPFPLDVIIVTITPYLSRDTTYCYRHCKGISRFPLLLHHPSPRPMPDRTFPHH